MLTSLPNPRLQEARRRLAALTERLGLENLAHDYRHGNDPTTSLEQLVKLQELKKKLGV